MGDEFSTTLQASFFSTFRIIFIAFCGYLLVKYKMVDKQIMKGIAEVTANFLIPCLSVSEICKSFKIKEWEMWLPILIYCFLNVGFGYLIGEFICLCFRGLKSEVKRLVLIVCMFSNSTSMQLVYVESLASILAKMIGTTPSEAKSRGYVVVLIYTIFVNFLRWSVGFNLMKPDPHVDELDKSQSNEAWNYSKDLTVKALHNKLDIDERRPNQIADKDSLSTNSNRSLSNFKQVKNENPCWKIIKEGMNMPFIAGVAAIIISTIPYVNNFFSDPDSYGYKLITESCDAVGKCVSSIVILILGLNLTISLKENVDLAEPLPKMLIGLVMITKAVIFPFIGLFAVWYIGFNYKLVNDPLVCFLILTNFCTPTAINMITIAIINKFQVGNLSTLLIYQYLLGVITVTVWTAVYMNLFIN